MKEVKKHTLEPPTWMIPSAFWASCSCRCSVAVSGRVPRAVAVPASECKAACISGDIGIAAGAGAGATTAATGAGEGCCNIPVLKPENDIGLSGAGVAEVAGARG